MRIERLNGWSTCCAVLLLLVAGCTTSKVVRLDTGEGTPSVITPRKVVGAEVETAELHPVEWAGAVRELARTARPFTRMPLREARALFGVPSLSGVYEYDWRNKRLIGLTAETRALHLDDPDERLAKDYLRWCERGGSPPGDCLGILETGPLLRSEAKFTLALALGMGSVWDGTEAELRSLTSGRALAATIATTVAMYFTLLILPEPVSKGVAAVISVAAIAWLGFDTFIGLLDAWADLVLKSDAALTFGELRDVGDAFGKVLGEKGARFFVMMATAATGRTAGELASKVPTLPGASQAALTLEGQAGVRLGALVQVHAVAVNSEGITIHLAPSAVAMASEKVTRRRPAPRSQRSTASTISPLGQGQGYPTFDAFKQAHGKAGEGRAWHHLVEQREANVKRFGVERIHNTDNLVLLDKTVHDRISALYSSIRHDITESTVLTVRQWMNTQSFEAQHEFGLLVLKNVSNGVW
ncbi:SitA5 family polymorphic toxin [Pyxidicoccus xibeiensis]|uniref:SitA5 family polymorphic toxin n=1 Tax=Pyxidicoccus xibeiensis TaxID=2906759 RepID=UPI0020A6F1C4|nr:hypothetical protein [Pyxidicoccus xibeiensis]MCP3140062.1 hypothetical protein [Pyxidicoccus xibeiensis]